MKIRYPKWFPYPSSWLNAILLTALARGAVEIIRVFFRAGTNALVDPFMTFNPDAQPEIAYSDVSAFFLLVIIGLLSPIPFIAIVHHLIHLFLNRFAPSIQAPEVGQVKGIFPGLVSWWEGLWSWAVGAISLLIMVAVGFITFDAEGFDSQSLSEDDINRFETILTLTWLLSCAYLYQICHLVEQRLLNAHTKLNHQTNQLGKT